MHLQFSKISLEAIDVLTLQCVFKNLIKPAQIGK